jgi:transcriptional regulator with XRE-family HTH domain
MNRISFKNLVKRKVLRPERACIGLRTTEHIHACVSSVKHSSVYTAFTKISDYTLEVSMELLVATKKTSPKPDSFGTRLRGLRMAKGFTQVELADAIGSSQRMITHYERHDGLPAAHIVLELANVLGVTPEQILGIKPTARKAAPETPESIRLWRRLKQIEQLSPAERRQILQLIEALVERRTLRREKAS